MQHPPCLTSLVGGMLMKQANTFFPSAMCSHNTFTAIGKSITTNNKIRGVGQESLANLATKIFSL